MSDAAYIHSIIKIRLSNLGYLPDIPYHLISDGEMIDAFIDGDRNYRNNSETHVRELVSVTNLRGYFADTYPCPSAELQEDYDNLVRGIISRLDEYKIIHDPNYGKGDVNGDGRVDWLDVELLRRYIAGLEDIDDANLYNADVNGDGDINMKDVLVLRNMLSASIESEVIPNWIYSYMLGEVIGQNSAPKDIHDCLVLLNLDNLDDEFTPEAASACLRISKQWIRKLPTETATLRLAEDGSDIKVTRHRPPTIFGEPHVLKSLRLSAVV